MNELTYLSNEITNLRKEALRLDEISREQPTHELKCRQAEIRRLDGKADTLDAYIRRHWRDK